jgi:hypothetical protein
MHIQDASPIDYLKLINGAKYVITNSFHGSAFSANFGIPFMVAMPESGQNRILGLLKGCNLLDRYIDGLFGWEDSFFGHVDFTVANQFFIQERAHSTSFIVDALSC